MAKRTLLLLGALGLLVGLLWPVLTGSGSPTQAASEQSPASSVAVPSSQEVEPSPTVAPSTPKPTSDAPLIHAVKPTGMRIPGVTPKSGASVIAQPQYYGRNPQTGKSNVLMYDTPNNLDDVSWWSADPAGNPAPKPGSDPERNKYIAVFWGHTALNDKDGVFARLGTVKLGTRATSREPTARVYMVCSRCARSRRTRFPKTLRQRSIGVWTRHRLARKSPPAPALVMLTGQPVTTRTCVSCSGQSSNGRSLPELVAEWMNRIPIVERLRKRTRFHHQPRACPGAFPISETATFGRVRLLY